MSIGQRLWSEARSETERTRVKRVLFRLTGTCEIQGGGD